MEGKEGRSWGGSMGGEGVRIDEGWGFRRGIGKGRAITSAGCTLLSGRLGEFAPRHPCNPRRQPPTVLFLQAADDEAFVIISIVGRPGGFKHKLVRVRGKETGLFRNGVRCFIPAPKTDGLVFVPVTVLRP